MAWRRRPPAAGIPERLTARKAVRVLADEGLVEVIRGRGAYVAE